MKGIKLAYEKGRKEMAKEIIEWIWENRYLCDHKKVVESEEIVDFIRQESGNLE